ncbi:hypothetical protein ACEWY4_017592 [Coilia grayii]|uniref:Aprataxin and PNK-like factor n=1 Tax=Coilia grayii TaxID=363190 RepID=A0ABD1JHC9_9TELE
MLAFSIWDRSRVKENYQELVDWTVNDKCSQMPGFELKPLDDGNTVQLLEGETAVLGRGPLFGVNDKRVSRNHGVLENVDGKLRIKPTHLNPCFVQSSPEAPPQPLSKDQWHTLVPGDLFSLLPGKYIYHVSAKEDEGQREEEEEMEAEDEGTLRNSQNFQESKAVRLTLSSANEDLDRPAPLQDRGGPSVSQQSTLVGSFEGKSSVGHPDSAPFRDQCPDAAVGGQQDGGDERSPSPQRKRTLPAWMMAAAADDATKSPSTPKVAKRKGPAKGTTAPKPKPKPKPNPKPPTRATAAAAQSKATPKRARTRVRSSEAEEEEEEAPEEEEEEEEEVVQSAKKRRKMLIEEDEDEEEEKPEAAAAAAAAAYRPVRPTGQVTPGRDDVSEESDDMEVGQGKVDEEREEEEEKEKKKQRGRTPGTPSVSFTSRTSEDRPASTTNAGHKHSNSASQNGHKTSKATKEVKRQDSAAGSSSKKATNRTPCPYGSSCYRKNPIHFQECSHPGDSDYEEEAEMDVDEEDDDRPECPYGTDCYRKNPLHKKEYKHTRPPARASASRKDEDEDDDDEDAYEDSFINDDSEENFDEDSDYVPDGGSDDSGKEDIKRLQKEAKAFLRKKK